MTDSYQNSGIREQLDAVRPDSDDLADDGLRTAADALKQSRTWRDLLKNQQMIDRRIGVAMKDVPVPPGLVERLEAALSTACSPGDEGATPTVAPLKHVGRRSRRDVARLAMAAMVVVGCLTGGYFLWFGGDALLTLDELRNRMPLAVDGQIDLQRLSPFDDSFQLELPLGRWDRVEFSHPLGLDWTGDGRHDAAILSFTSQGRQPVRGHLLVVPASRVADPPLRTYLSATEISYIPTENTAAVNPTGDLVYLCFTPPGQLLRLGRLLYPQAA